MFGGVKGSSRLKIVTVVVLLTAALGSVFMTGHAAIAAPAETPVLDIQLSGQPFELPQTNSVDPSFNGPVVLGGTVDNIQEAAQGIPRDGDPAKPSPDGTKNYCTVEQLGIEGLLDVNTDNGFVEWFTTFTSQTGYLASNTLGDSSDVSSLDCYIPPALRQSILDIENCEGIDDIANLFADKDNCRTNEINAAISGVIGSVFEPYIKSFNEAVRSFFNWGVQWMFGTLLGGNGEATAATDYQHGLAAPTLNTSWFSSQMSLTKQIALYLIVPLFMLAIIQAILKGSLFFVIRAFAIMLPISILGSVVVVEFTRRLLWISDDISHFIAATALGDSYNWLNRTIDSYSGLGFSLFEVLWFVAGGLAFLVIYAELIIRELGVYLAVFFMPLAFAALVWPSTAKFARRMVELLLGLIFSKVFIVAALSMGLAAFQNAESSFTSTAESTGGGDLAGLTAAVAIFFMAAFAGTKVLEISPGASSAIEGRMTRPGAIMNKGHVANYILGKRATQAEKAVGRVQPSGAQTERTSPAPIIPVAPIAPSAPKLTGPNAGGSNARVAGSGSQSQANKTAAQAGGPPPASGPKVAGSGSQSRVNKTAAEKAGSNPSPRPRPSAAKRSPTARGSAPRIAGSRRQPPSQNP